MTQCEEKKPLKIAILTPTRIARIGAGDWVQAYNTAKGLRELGHNVVHILYGEKDERMLLPANVFFMESNDVPIDFDVLHFIPGTQIPIELSNRINNEKKRILLVASVIYWDSLIHRLVCMKGNGNFLQIIRYFGKRIFPYFSSRWMHFTQFDLLLCNSIAEISIIKRDHKVNPNAVVGNVPNAINPIPSWAYSCPPPKEVEKKKYIIYPGIFALRKNQLGFIRAMRDSPYKVVFMGGPIPTRNAGAYYNQCKLEAPYGWVFLGKVEHQSPQFYGAILHSRVACLASSCETPGIAMLEAASLGVRPAITNEGSTYEYFGTDAEYFNPLSMREIREALNRSWIRGDLSPERKKFFQLFTWNETARQIDLQYKVTMKKIGTTV